LTHFRALSIRTSTKDNVAREQTLVLSTLAIGRDRILRRASGGFFETRCLRNCWLGPLGFERLARFHRSKAFLIIPQSIRVRSRRSLLRLNRIPGRLRLTGDEDDQHDAEREACHEPRLKAARQHAARDRPMIADRRRSRSSRFFGHDHRPCCSNVKRCGPSTK
jgi:hypothetical protein